MLAGLLTLLLCRAPVPTHLMPPTAGDVVPGYRWHFGTDVLRCDWVEGDLVGFVNETTPATHWRMCHGVNVQTVAQTLAEAKNHGQPAGWRERLHYPR